MTLDADGPFNEYFKTPEEARLAWMLLKVTQNGGDLTKEIPIFPDDLPRMDGTFAERLGKLEVRHRHLLKQFYWFQRMVAQYMGIPLDDKEPEQVEGIDIV